MVFVLTLLQGYGQTLAPEPTIQAKDIILVKVSANTTRIKWTRGNGTGSIVIVRSDDPVNVVPVDQVAYTADSSYPSGAEVVTGSRSRVVYAGADSTVYVTGLGGGRTYYFTVFEYSGEGNSINYLLDGSPSNGATTSPAEPLVAASNITFTNIGPESVRISWTNGDGLGRLVVGRQGAEVTRNPSKYEVYRSNTSFPLGEQLPGTSLGHRVVYAGRSNFVDVTGLVPGATYHFAVYEYTGAGYLLNYRITDPPKSSVTTLAQTAAVRTAVNNTAVYPNRFSDKISFVIADEQSRGASATIVDTQGNSVYTSKDHVTNTVNEVQGLQKLPRGIYYLRLTYGDAVESVRIVKE